MPVNNKSFATTDSIAIEPSTLIELSSSLGIGVLVAGAGEAVTASLGSIIIIPLSAAGVVLSAAASALKKGEISIWLPTI